MISRTRAVVCLALLGSLSWTKPAQVAAVEPTPRFDTVVVCASQLLPAMRPWIEFRRRQGHEIALVNGDGTAERIRRDIRSIARESNLQHVVLVGDAVPAATERGLSIPTHRREARVIRQWGSERTFGTDAWYADVDDDEVPDLSVGRISADSQRQLAGIVAKILAYEQSQSTGPWRRRINFVAGIGGFGAITDAVLETATKKLITDGIPSGYRTSMTQASWRSPYAPDPRLFRAQTIERLNEGCLAWVYLGHGRQRELDYFRVPGGDFPILSVRDVPQIASRNGSPIAVFLSCHAGAFDAEHDCLAEELLEAPGGPVAVIAGSSVTMPYAMTVMGNAILKQLFVERRGTIGEVLLYAKQVLARNPEDRNSLIDNLAAVMSPQPDLLAEERREHVSLFNLIGDPLLRIHHPRNVLIDVQEYGTAGEILEVHGTSDVDGPSVIELVCRRDRLTFKPARRAEFDATEAGLQAMQETYVKANDGRWSATAQKIVNGTFFATLPIPREARGPSHVRVFVQGEHEFAIGSRDIYLRMPEEADEQR